MRSSATNRAVVVTYPTDLLYCDASPSENEGGERNKVLSL